MTNLIGGRIVIGNYEDALDFEQLREKGITGVLNCAVDIDYTPADDMEYVKVGMFDNGYNHWHLFEYAVDSLVILLSKHDKVLVHCHGGVSRSVLVVAAYLVIYKGFKNLDSALEHVAEFRPQLWPNKYLLNIAEKFISFAK